MLEQISLDEVVLIFGKLADEGASILCVGRMRGWQLAVRGKVSMGAEKEIILKFDGGRGQLMLSLDEDDTCFWYSEPGKMPLPERDSVPEEARDSACISLALPLRIRPGEFPAFEADVPRIPGREKLFFLEIREVSQK